MLKKIRRPASIGLYGSIGVAILTLRLYLFGHYRFYANEHTYSAMLVAGSVLAVLAVITILFTVRKSTPRLRQMEDIQSKLTKYAEQTTNIYYTSLAIVVVECILITLSHNSVLFMLLIILVLTLILLYPNILKIKVDLGLSDEEVAQLENSDL